MASKDNSKKSTDSEFYTKAVLWLLVGAGVVVGALIMLLKATHTLH